MSVLRPTPVSTSRFHYDSATACFMADASDLHGIRPGRVYDDAADLGLTLVSDSTGSELVFAEEREQRDREGELLFTEYRQVTPHPHGLTFRVCIYND